MRLKFEGCDTRGLLQFVCPCGWTYWRGTLRGFQCENPACRTDHSQVNIITAINAAVTKGGD